MITKKYIDELSFKIIGAAIEVHRVLGPGLLESICEKCLIHELKLLGLDVKSQIWIPIDYKGIELEGDLRLDILVEELVVVEVKAVELVHPVNDAIILSYMKLLKKPKGLMFNFHSDNITKNIRTFINDYYGALPD